MNFKKQIHFSSDMGRMGNQMFHYACAKGMQEKYGIITSLSHLDKLEYFKLSKNDRLFNKIKSFLFFRVWKKIWGADSINTELQCLHRDYTESLSSITKPTTVWGFFQSPIYFANISERFKSYFEVKKSCRNEFDFFLNQNKLSPGSYIAIHLRRTDYKSFTVPGLKGDDFTLPISYYTNAFKQLKHLNDEQVVFVSDDPEGIMNLFPDIEHKIISKNSAITDFLILQQAKKLVISNSTFAWWAAYTSPFADSAIICPKYFLGFKEELEVPLNIYPKDWKQIDVF